MEALHAALFPLFGCLGSCDCDSHPRADLPEHAGEPRRRSDLPRLGGPVDGQRAASLVSRIEALSKPIVALIVVSSVLLVGRCRAVALARFSRAFSGCVGTG